MSFIFQSTKTGGVDCILIGWCEDSCSNTRAFLSARSSKLTGSMSKRIGDIQAILSRYSIHSVELLTLA